MTTVDQGRVSGTPRMPSRPYAVTTPRSLGALLGALHRGTGDGFDAGLRYLVGPGEPGDRVTRRHRKRTPPSNEVLHGVIQ